MRLFTALRPNHDRTWGTLASAFVDGEADGRERALFLVHSSSCPRCAARISGYRLLSTGIRGTATAHPTPHPGSILAAAGERHTRVGPLPGRLALAASVFVLAAGGIAAAPGARTAVTGAVQYVRAVVAPGDVPATGDRAFLSVPHGSAVVTAVQRFGLYSAETSGSGARESLLTSLPAGPVCALADNRVLLRIDSAEGPAWVTAAPDGDDVRSFPLPATADLLDITANGRQLLVRDSGATRRIYMVDETGATVWTDNTPAAVSGLSPDGRFVLAVTSADVQLIPVDGGNAIHIPTGTHPAEKPQVSFDGTRVAFVQQRVGPGEPPLSYSFGRLSPEFSVPLTAPVPAGVDPVFRLSPDGRLLAIVSSPLGTPVAAGQQAGTAPTALVLWNLDDGTPQEIRELRGTTISSLAWSADSKRLLVLDRRDGHTEAWQRGPTGPAAQLLKGTDVRAAAWSTDGSAALLLSDGGRTTGDLAVSVSAGGKVSVKQVSSTPDRSVYARDGSTVALLSATGDARLAGRSGAAPQGTGRAVQDFALAPDGRSGVAVAGGNAYLWSSRTGTAAAPFATGDHALWSDDGRTILITTGTTATLYGPAGDRLRELPDGVVPASLSWSPGGDRLAGMRAVSGRFVLATFDVRTGDENDLADVLSSGSTAWSPAGDRLAYVAAGDAGAALYSITLQTKAARWLAPVASAAEPLVWLQGGREIAYIARSAGGVPGSLVAADPAGGTTRSLLDAAVSGLYSGPR